MAVCLGLLFLRDKLEVKIILSLHMQNVVDYAIDEGSLASSSSTNHNQDFFWALFNGRFANPTLANFSARSIDTHTHLFFNRQTGGEPGSSTIGSGIHFIVVDNLSTEATMLCVELAMVSSPAL